MVLARNTYRFSLLVVGYAIAYEVGAGGAVVGFALGTFALLAGTLAHYAGAASPSAGEENGDAGGGDEEESGGTATSGASHGWY